MVPVLVGGASLPSASELPSDLVPLLQRNAVSLSDRNWDHEVSELIQELEDIRGVRSPLEALRRSLLSVLRPSVKGRDQSFRRRPIVVGAAILAAAAATASIVDESGLSPATFGDGYPTPVEVKGRFAEPVASSKSPASTIDLTGNWIDATGFEYAFEQFGAEVTFYQLSGVGAGFAGGSGWLDGQTLNFSYAMNGTVLSQGQAMLSPDRQSLSGSVVDALGMVAPVYLRRL